MSYEYNKRDVYDFAHAISADVHEKGNELFWKFCPHCRGGGSDKETFSINLDTGAFNCFRSSCGYHGHFVELCRDFGYQLENINYKPYKKLPQVATEAKESAISYLETRGIPAHITRKYRISARKENENIIVFPFYDENGVLTFVKYRNTKYVKGQGGSKEWCETDTKPILFGMYQCNAENTTLIITEGQVDSLSVAACGYENCVSVPTGCNGFTWLTHCWDWLMQFTEIIVFGDCENGKITLLDTLQRRLPQKIKAVRKLDYLGEKDANDILCRFGEDAIHKCIDNAEIPRLENVKKLSEVQCINIQNMPKIRTGLPDLDKVIGGLYFGQLALITGKRGEGKSTVLSQILVDAIEQGESVFAYSGELADYHFKHWLDLQIAGANALVSDTNEYGQDVYSVPEAVEAKINQWYDGKVYVYDNAFIPDGSDEVEPVIETVEKAIQRYGVRVIAIDNLMTAMDGETDNIWTAQGAFVTKLKRLAMRYNVIVLLVAHPRKSKDDFTNDDVSGSADITNRADIVMSFGRVGDSDCDGRLTVSKNRITGKLAVKDNAIPLKYSPSDRRVRCVYDQYKHYGWETIKTDASENNWLI